MKLRKSVIFVLLGVALFVTGCGIPSSPTTPTAFNWEFGALKQPISEIDPASYRVDELLIVTDQNGLDAALLDRIGGNVVFQQTIDNIKVYKITLVGSSVPDAYQKVYGATGIKLVQPVFIYDIPEKSIPSMAPETPPTATSRVFSPPTDDRYTSDQQWGLRAINATAGWPKTTGSTSTIIAIVDTGVDASHADLNGKVLAGYNTYEIPHTTDVTDDVGHGTHCAGIAAGKANNDGIVGVNWNAKILPVKVLGPHGGDDISVGDGIKWAVDNGADVISMSLGGAGYSPYLLTQINYALSFGVVVICANGNSGKRNESYYPAGFAGTTDVIAVGAMNAFDQPADFTTASDHVTLSAPGVDILSSLPEDLYPTGYGRWDGTSMATPFVSGAASLLVYLQSSMTPAQIKSAFEDSARDIDATGWDEKTGYGCLDLGVLLQP